MKLWKKIVIGFSCVCTYAFALLCLIFKHKADVEKLEKKHKAELERKENVYKERAEIKSNLGKGNSVERVNATVDVLQNINSKIRERS